jgi:hypothetical protein
MKHLLECSGIFNLSKLNNHLAETRQRTCYGTTTSIRKFYKPSLVRIQEEEKSVGGGSDF